MKIEVRRITSWADALEAARTTMGLECRGNEPSAEWKRKILMCRHSPIEALEFMVTMTDIPYFVSVHLVRHKIGITHWVRSQRTDRTGIVRDKLPQDALVVHRMKINAQALIAVSKKRLCMKASLETRRVWQTVKDEMAKVDYEMALFMRPECWWCGGECPEMKGCGRCPAKPMPGAPFY